MNCITWGNPPAPSRIPLRGPVKRVGSRRLFRETVNHCQHHHLWQSYFLVLSAIISITHCTVTVNAWRIWRSSLLYQLATSYNRNKQKHRPIQKCSFFATYPRIVIVNIDRHNDDHHHHRNNLAPSPTSMQTRVWEIGWFAKNVLWFALKSSKIVNFTIRIITVFWFIWKTHTAIRAKNPKGFKNTPFKETKFTSFSFWTFQNLKSRVKPK